MGSYFRPATSVLSLATPIGNTNLKLINASQSMTEDGDVEDDTAQMQDANQEDKDNKGELRRKEH